MSYKDYSRSSQQQVAEEGIIAGTVATVRPFLQILTDDRRPREIEIVVEDSEKKLGALLPVEIVKVKGGGTISGAIPMTSEEAKHLVNNNLVNVKEVDENGKVKGWRALNVYAIKSVEVYAEVKGENGKFIEQKIKIPVTVLKMA